MIEMEPQADEEVGRPRKQSAEGQRLDAARAEFRAGWQAKLDRKREQAIQARWCEDRWLASQGKILVGGSGVGAAFGLIVTAASARPLESIPFCLVIGIVGGLILALPLLFSAVVATANSRMRAERLEREVREMERS